MKLITDLHLHSKYSQAVSKYMDLQALATWGKKKGIDLLATGDWTHPEWFASISQELSEVSEGIYQLSANPEIKFLLSTELSCVYTQGGRGRRTHILVFSPNLEVCQKINTALVKAGCNLASDGRPILGLSLIELCELIWAIDETCLLIPAHAWTPWYGFYGSKSGFDSLEEGFGAYASKIYALETGLSSDPPMNQLVSEVATRSLVSFSDAHSMPKLGRESTVFELKNKTLGYTYQDLYQAIAERSLGQNGGNLQLTKTLEFFPQEGKYHWDGHRNCHFSQSAQETLEKGSTCPVCGREITVGVEYRVYEVAKLQGHVTPDQDRHYQYVVPLQEIIADVLAKGIQTKKVQAEYESMLETLGSEFQILLSVPEADLRVKAKPAIAQAIMDMRACKVEIEPGFDGQFGVVKFPKQESEQLRMV